jgi:glycosyltransferase involved in cell wall biosynthesis
MLQLRVEILALSPALPLLAYSRLEHLPAATFLVVGDGPRRGELETLATQLGVAPAVRFLGTRHDVPELLAACDLAALTSHNEASPVSILEALSVGRPVVAANVGSVSESVLDGQTGRLFPAGDVGAFAAAMMELLVDAPLRRRLGAAGRALVLERWSLDAMVRGYEQLIERIYQTKIGAPGPRSANLGRNLTRRRAASRPG